METHTPTATPPIEMLTNVGLPQRDSGNPLHQFRTPDIRPLETDNTKPSPASRLAAPATNEPGFRAIWDMRRYQQVGDWASGGKAENFDLDGMSGVQQNRRPAAYIGQALLHTIRPCETTTPRNNHAFRPLQAFKRALWHLGALRPASRNTGHERPAAHRATGRHSRHDTLL